LWIDVQERKANERKFIMDQAFWVPAYTDEKVEAFLKWTKEPYRRLDNIAKEAAQILAQDKVIGWYQGRMEFGPRALNSRSILASPIHAEMEARLNDIKDREDFRPVAPVVFWRKTCANGLMMLLIHPSCCLYTTLKTIRQTIFLQLDMLMVQQEYKPLISANIPAIMHY